MPTYGLWRSRFASSLVIPKGASDSYLGGYPEIDAMNYDGPRTFVLAEDLDNSETGVDVATGTGRFFRPGFKFTIDSEGFQVLSVSGDTLTVNTRPFSGSAATHDADAVITLTNTWTSLEDAGDGVIDLTGVSWGSLIFPAGAPGWTAADVCFLASAQRHGTFVPVREEDGTLLQITNLSTTVSSSRYIPGKVFAAGPFIKIRSMTVGTDPTSLVAQAAARVITFVGGE